MNFHASKAWPGKFCVPARRLVFTLNTQHAIQTASQVTAGGKASFTLQKRLAIPVGSLALDH